MDRLIKKIVELKNPTVVGLDPVLAYIPQYIKEKQFAAHGNTFKAAAEAILEFNKGIINEICDIVPAVKPQSAYYEMYGFEGVRILHATIEYAKSNGMYVICDGKRNDIGSTAEAYSAAYLGKTTINGEYLSAFDADSLTVNGYLGSDGLKPFITDCDKYDKSIFVLVKTSNPSSGELQDLNLASGDSVYISMADLIGDLGNSSIGKYGFSSIGAVVGATYPEQLRDLRVKYPSIFFLVPGYGAQGGKAEDIKHAFNKDGIGAIVNSSRAIMCAYQKEKADEKDFAKCARAEAIRMRDEIG